MKQELLALVFESIDLEKLCIGIVHLGEKEAAEAAAKTATPVDDAIIAVAVPALNPLIESYIKKGVASLKAKLSEV